jgi:hypothetical protein
LWIFAASATQEFRLEEHPETDVGFFVFNFMIMSLFQNSGFERDSTILNIIVSLFLFVISSARQFSHFAPFESHTPEV